MEDLLASIRRAIGEEGIDPPDRPSPVLAPRPSVPAMRRIPAAVRQFEDPPPLSAVRGGGRELRTVPSSDRHDGRQPTPSIDIQALRTKIGKELLAEPDPTPNATPPRQAASAPVPQFRGILSGPEERRRPRGDVLVAPSATAPRSPRSQASRPPFEETAKSLASRPTFAETAKESLQVERPPVPLKRVSEMAPHATAFDIPAPGAAGFRPPFGTGSFGIRGFSPPNHRPEPAKLRPEPGMMSAESDSLAAGAFGKLADALLQRGERSIDDLTRELLRPLLKQWLDQNLPPLVESLVREEIERVARRGGR